MFFMGDKPMRGGLHILAFILTTIVLLPRIMHAAGQPEAPQKVSSQHERYIPLRTTPTTLTEDDIAAMIRAYGFYEGRIHPDQDIFNRYVRIVLQNDVVVHDATHHLFWATGLVVRASFENAGEVVSTLNYAGFQDWRVPTVEELVSVLTPRQGTYHYEKAFLEFQAEGAWSADRVPSAGSETFGWFIRFDTGQVVSLPGEEYQRLLLVRDALKPRLDATTGASIRGLSKDW